MAQTFNFGRHYKGDTLETTRFTIKNKETQEPIDLTGATILCQFCRNFSRAIVADLSIGSGLTVVDPLLGQVEIDSFDVNWDIGGYDYSMVFTYSDDTVITDIVGTINIIRK